MNRDVALRLSGLLMGVSGSLNHVAHFLKENLSEEEFIKYRSNIGKAMGETFAIASDLYRVYPEITPDSLKNRLRTDIKGD
jgi:hypothetical protein